MLFQINPSFTKKNQLKLNLSKNFVNQNFKLCFSLVYSIQSIDGAEIINQTGRYYELIIKKNTVLIDLQIPRIGSYNMSCGPEGTFIIDNKNNLIAVEVADLKFENEIEEVKYDQLTIDQFTLLKYDIISKKGLSNLKTVVTNPLSMETALKTYL